MTRSFEHASRYDAKTDAMPLGPVRSRELFVKSRAAIANAFSFESSAVDAVRVRTPRPSRRSLCSHPVPDSFLRTM